MYIALGYGCMSGMLILCQDLSGFEGEPGNFHFIVPVHCALTKWKKKNTPFAAKRMGCFCMGLVSGYHQFLCVATFGGSHTEYIGPFL
jgi:hypothetical protein